MEELKAKTSSVHSTTAPIGLDSGIWSVQNSSEFCSLPASFASSNLNHNAANFHPAASSFGASLHLPLTVAETSCSTFGSSDYPHISNKANSDQNYTHANLPIFSLSSYLESSFASPISDDMLYVACNNIKLPSVLPSGTTRRRKPTTTTTRILLAAHCAGCIIGHGGNVIKSIRDISGAYVTILDRGSENRNSSYRLVTLVGPLQAVGTAIQMIGLQADLFDNDLSVDQSGLTQVMSGGSGLNDYQHPSMATQSSVSSAPSYVSHPLYSRGTSHEREAGMVNMLGHPGSIGMGIHMIVDSVMLGKLTGKYWWRVNEIQWQTGVRRIQVLSTSESKQEGSIRNERIVVILGTAEQCLRAHREITLILEADPLSLERREEQRGLGERGRQNGPCDNNLTSLKVDSTPMKSPSSVQYLSLLEREEKEEYDNSRDRAGCEWHWDPNTNAAGEKQEKDEGNEEDQGNDEVSKISSSFIAPKAEVTMAAKSLSMGATGAGNVSRTTSCESEAFPAPAMSVKLLPSTLSEKLTTDKARAIATNPLSLPSTVFSPLPLQPSSSSSSATSSLSSPVPSVDECGNTSVQSVVNADAKKNFREFSAQFVVHISNQNIGRLIGKGGSTIRLLRHETKCQIEVENYHHSMDMREVRIRGTLQQVHMAVGMLGHQLFGREDGVC